MQLGNKLKRYFAVLLMVTLLAGCGADAQEQPGVGAQTEPLCQPDITESAETETESKNVESNFALQSPSGETESFANYRVTLTEAVTFEADYSLSTIYGVLVDYAKRDGLTAYTIFSFDGQDKLGEPVHAYTNCGNGVVITTVYTPAGPVRKLVNVNTGEVYLADDAATISKVNDRFYYVTYITEETDNEDECFVYATKVDDNVQMHTSLNLPAEGEVMYKGYAKIFDLQTGQFVKGLRIEDRETEAQGYKNTLCLHSDTGWSFYSADGSLLAEKMTNVLFGEELIIRQIREGCEIYDADLNKVSFLEGAEYIGGTNGRCSDRYFEYKENDRVGVMKITGEKLTEPVYKYAIEAYGDYIVCKNDDETVTIVYGDGSVVVPGGAYKNAKITDNLPAIYLNSSEQYTYWFGGTLLENVTINTDLVAKRNPNEFLIYSTGEWTEFENAKVLSNGLLRTEEGIVDVFTGSVLLPGEFEAVMGSDEYLYIYNDGLWTVYSITLTKG